ncbi:MAG: NAD(P)/FAD-dependent oxidoreductase [Candidatus Caldarchaeales archaeon]
MSKFSRIPGMLFIIISFIPWIIYWTLSSMGYALGIIFSFLISLIIIIPQVFKRDFNLMDIASISYFSIALLSTSIFNLNIFITHSGFLGYLTLSLMAITSILVKKPYTLQVSKRDYPEIYWKDKLFLTINSVITGFWATIFLSNAIISLALESILSIVISNILIASGVVFSIIFPLEAPAYFTTKNLKKYDWRVNVNPSRKIGEDEYDVIIVGAGIGGLACGALLSKRGYRVLVLEQHFQVGGYCSSFQREEFTFNSGVADVSGLWEKGPITYLLRELQLKKEELFVKNKMRIIFRGEEINISNGLDSLVKLLSDKFPDEKEKISEFFRDAEKAYEECYRESEIYGVPLPAELIVKVYGKKKFLNYPKEHPHFYDWMNKTYKQKLDEYFKNENLKGFLCALLGYVGAEPERVLASSALTASVSYFLHGGYYPKGGAQRFAEILREFIEEHGGKVLTKHKVEKILLENGKVVGVRVGWRIFKSSIIVSNVNAKSTFLELVGEDYLDKKFVNYIKNLRMSPSAFMVFLGVDMDLSDYPTLINNIDDGYEVVINSNADPSLAPKGKTSITIMTRADYHDFPERGTEEYMKRKKEFAEILIKKVEKIIPGLSRSIIVQDEATPKTFERYTLMPEGAIYAFDQSIDIVRPFFKSPIKGLYLVGASTFPGGGIEAVVISGIICANDICEWKIR